MKRNKVLIIAEAGVNHNGSIEMAKRLALVAKEAGADIVKFQTAKLDSLVSSKAEMALYQKRNLGADMSQKEMIKKLLLTYDEFRELNSYCREIGIQFLSTPFDIESITFLNELHVPFWKIPSGEITNLPYLIKIAETHKDIILSTGMSDMNEIETALRVLRKYGSGAITLLHCTTQYPTPYEDVNLNAMAFMKEKFHVAVGYSDHTLGIEVPIAAVAMGAEVIEKHFTLDRNAEGPDHRASLEPDELEKMIVSVRNIERAMGEKAKKVVLSEQDNIAIARKSIVAAKPIAKGEVFTEKNITTKRPGSGVSPMKWFEVLGQKAKRDFQEDELIEI